MAESGTEVAGVWSPPASLEDARTRAQVPFKDRLQAGQEIAGCGCAEGDEVRGGEESGPPLGVVGVRFRDSGRVYYFRPPDEDLQVGDWVVVPANRGDDAGRVVIAPHQVRHSLIQGEIGAVTRRLSDEDVSRMSSYERESAAAVKLLGEQCRARKLGIKPVAADYSFDGATILFRYSVPDRERAPDAEALRGLAHQLAADLGCRVEPRQVGPHDEVRLLGGLGRCGRTLCCSSWLPVFPEISMNKAKNQDLPLNPGIVSGVCGRLPCCLSYENEQYRQMKAVMPKLGQAIDTPGGPGMVVSLHLLKELVTVRLDGEAKEATFRRNELRQGSSKTQVVPSSLPVSESIAADVTQRDPTESLEPSDAAPGPSDAERTRGRRRGARRTGKSERR